MQALKETSSFAPAREEKKLMQWTKWSLLRAVASQGVDAQALKSLPTDLLRRKLLLRTSSRKTDSYMNKTDYYVINVYAARHADPQRWLAEESRSVRPRPGFPQSAKR